MQEIWKDIVGYEGLYQVSTFGRIKSLSKQIKHIKGFRSINEKILKTFKNRYGYECIKLCKNSKYIHHRIHRLVLMMFNPIENMENLDCCHIDTIKTNNVISNLHWGTRSENNLNDISMKKHSKAVSQFTLDGVFIKDYISAQEFGREIGKKVQGTIHYVCDNKRNSAYGFKWKWKEGD